MPSDPNTKIPLSESLDNEIDRLLSAGLENFSVRELLGMMLSAAGQAERSAYLAETTGDKGNGKGPGFRPRGAGPDCVGCHTRYASALVPLPHRCLGA